MWRTQEVLAGEKDASRPVEVRLDGVFRLVELLCDFADGPVFHMMQLEKHFLLFTQHAFHGFTELMKTFGAFIFIERRDLP